MSNLIMLLCGLMIGNFFICGVINKNYYKAFEISVHQAVALLFYYGLTNL